MVDFDKFIEAFNDKVSRDTVLNMGAHYIQGLFTHLHMSGLFSASTYVPGLDGFMGLLNDSPLRRWKDVPATLWLTIVVPHSKLWLFQKKHFTETGSPVCHIALQHSDGRQNFFPDLQLGFGRLRTAGVKHTGDYIVFVDPDEREWHGKSPLIVSVMIPTWLALYDLNHSTEVAFALKSTPETAAFIKDLGMMLELHKSTLAGEDVYLTTNPPNLAGHPSLPCISETATPNDDSQQSSPLSVLAHPSDQTTTETFTALLDSEATRIDKLNVHLAIASPEARSLLTSKAAVSVDQPSPFQLRFNIGVDGFHTDIRLPLPLSMSGGRTTIARTSAYLEFIGTIASPTAMMCRSDGMTSASLVHGEPLLETLPYVSLDILPILDIQNTRSIMKRNWIATHVGSMFSARERTERDRCHKLHITPDDARVCFKDTVFMLFMASTGADRDAPKQHTFALTAKGAPGIEYLIGVSSVRIDLASHSIVLDAALLPTTKENNVAIKDSIDSSMGPDVSVIEIDEKELAAWQQTLPAFVERCRDWQHGAECEYARPGASFPLATGRGETVLCSCGRGKFPKDYNQHIPAWNLIAPHCTRIAITPLFPVPIVEKVLDLDSFEATGLASMINGKKGCWNCGRQEVKLLKCSKCMIAEYCSKDCQRIDWKENGHKMACKKLFEFTARRE